MAAAPWPAGGSGSVRPVTTATPLSRPAAIDARGNLEAAERHHVLGAEAGKLAGYADGLVVTRRGR